MQRGSACTAGLTSLRQQRLQKSGPIGMDKKLVQQPQVVPTKPAVAFPRQITWPESHSPPCEIHSLKSDEEPMIVDASEALFTDSRRTGERLGALGPSIPDCTVTRLLPKPSGSRTVRGPQAVRLRRSKRRALVSRRLKKSADSCNKARPFQGTKERKSLKSCQRETGTTTPAIRITS